MQKIDENNVNSWIIKWIIKTIDKNNDQFMDNINWLI